MINVDDDDKYQPKLGGSRKMKKQSGHAIRSFDPQHRIQGIGQMFKRTSIMISLCSSIPLRMFAAVIPVMIMRAPIMNPCDQASRVRAIDPSGFDIMIDVEIR